MSLSFENSLQLVADDDVEALIESRIAYGDSWRAEGGFSAYFNIKRKIDRFVKLLGRDPVQVADIKRERYDVFGHIQADLREGGETVLDTVRDLRRYLLLAEAFLVQSSVDLPLSRDNLAACARHAREEIQVAEDLDKAGPELTINVEMFMKDSFPSLTNAILAEKTNAVLVEKEQQQRWPDKGPRGFDPAEDVVHKPFEPMEEVWHNPIQTLKI